jgi:hypothetical protein
MASNDAVPTTEQLQDLLLESPGFTEFLLGVATISASLLDGRESLLCAITVERDAGPSTVASSTAAAQRLDLSWLTGRGLGVGRRFDLR